MKNFILILAMLLLPAAGFAQSGTTGSLNWALAGGTLTISGTGAMPDYESYGDDAAPWQSSRQSITTVIIESGVTNIGIYAFKRCTVLTSVAISGSVTNIGGCAFEDCSSLASISIPGTVRRISYAAFGQCVSLRDVTVGWMTPALIFVSAPFVNDGEPFTPSCTLHVPPGTKALYAATYAWEEFGTIIEDSPLVEAGKIEIYRDLNGDGIGNEADAPAVTELAFRASEEYLRGALVFVVSDVSWTATCSDSWLTFTDVSEEIGIEGGYAIRLEVNTDAPRTGTITFSGGEATKILTVHQAGITGDFEVWDGAILDYRGSGGNVVIPEGITTIGYGAFEGRDDLLSVTFPSTLVSIDIYAFAYCEGITSVDFPPSLVAIGSSAFFGTGLSTVNIPATLTSVGTVAFGGEKLTAVHVDPNHPGYSSVDGIVFDKEKSVLILYPGGKTAESYTIPSSVTRIESGAFAFSAHLTSLSLPASLTDIGELAFFRCTGLTSIDLPASLTSIRESVFAGCEALESVTIPASVGNIEDYAFEGCIRLTSLYVNATIPPTTGVDVFYEVNTSACTLYVPLGSKAAYEAADVWKDFHTITAVSNAVVEAADVHYANGILTVNSPAAERIDVYSAAGALLYQVQKASGEATFNFNRLPQGVLIVRGGSGWTRKIVNSAQ
jgi:hypothetical protein